MKLQLSASEGITGCAGVKARVGYLEEPPEKASFCTYPTVKVPPLPSGIPQKQLNQNMISLLALAVGLSRLQEYSGHGR